MHSRSLALAIATPMLIAPAVAADSPVNFTFRDAKGNIHDFNSDGKAWTKPWPCLAEL